MGWDKIKGAQASAGRWKQPWQDSWTDPAAAVDVAGMEDAGGRYRLLSHKDFVEELRDQWPCKSWL